ncbi:bifunctional diguanylate cyclase/phosphodiesterase [Pseudoxanthomonas sp. LjRoot143]|uniref:putative bifunctional diguanylate cyclase/phosphodiesterase n=1 Tax=Pseudoxanthomonas sp. LjRoot143 TaxID=3342266 RepID=UPI003ECDF0BD
MAIHQDLWRPVQWAQRFAAAFAWLLAATLTLVDAGSGHFLDDSVPVVGVLVAIATWRSTQRPVRLAVAGLLTSLFLMHLWQFHALGICLVLAAATVIAWMRVWRGFWPEFVMRIFAATLLLLAVQPVLGALQPGTVQPEIGWSLSLSALAMFLLVYTPALREGRTLDTSTELVAFVMAFALIALVGWHVPGSLVGKMGVNFPPMRPLSTLCVAGVALALLLRQRDRERPAWALLALIAVPLLLTLLQTLGGVTTPVNALLHQLGWLPRASTPLIGGYTDYAVLTGWLAVAVLPQALQRWESIRWGITRGFGIALASVAGMATLGLLIQLPYHREGLSIYQISLTSSAQLVAMGLALAVAGENSLRERLFGVLPMAAALMLGGMYWGAATADRDAMARNVMKTQTASAAPTFLRGMELRRGALRQLSASLTAAAPDAAEGLFHHYVDDMVSAYAGFRVVRSVGDGGEFRWVEPGFDAPVAPSPPVPVAQTGHLHAVPGGWWLTVDTAGRRTQGFIALDGFVKTLVKAVLSDRPVRATADGMDTLEQGEPQGSPLSVERVPLPGHDVQLELWAPPALNSFTLPRALVVGGLSSGLLIAFVLFLLDISRRRSSEAAETARSLLLETERRLDAQRRLNDAAAMDSATGLPRFSAQASLITERIAAPSAHGHGLAIVDLDGFGMVNDSFGHDGGDEVLRRMGQRISAACEGQGAVYRYGGEGFLVLFPDIDIDQLSRCAEEIRRAVGQPVALYSTHPSFTVTASIGLAHAPEHGADLQTLLRCADDARHLAKRAGRNQVRLPSATTQQETSDRLSRVTALREAVARGQLRLVYQPVVAGDSSQLTGFEALARWRHPAWGDVPPSVFIPLAESAGLMEDIGHFVLEQACQQLARWRAMGLRTLGMAVNLSPSQLGQPTLAPWIANCLQRHDLPPDALTLELTESVLVEDMGAAQQMLQTLHALGVRLALDDFGTGYSSMAYLQRLPLDILKIDRSFVDGIAAESTDRAIARTILVLAHEMGMRTIAEGVETSEQMHALQQMGCDEMQGYFFGRPMEVDEATTLARGELRHAQA